MPTLSKKIALKNEKGFTLIEALVAITVMMLSIVGPMAIAQKGIQNTVFARDQIVAFYIAQEGVELVRSIRDDNALTGAPWLTTISATPACTNAAGTGCGIDVDNMNFISCTGTACDLYYHASGLASGSDRGIYSHVASGGQATIYSRSIKVLSSTNPDEVSIDVTVQWLSRGTVKTITVQSRMFNQYNNL